MIRQLLVAVALTAMATGCSTSTPASEADGVIARSGRVPVPTAPAIAAPVTATPGHPQLLAMGAPVFVVLGDQSGQITALGPDVVPVPGVRDLATGTITVTAPTGFALHPDQFSCRDETGRDVALSPADPDHSGALRLAGTFHAGAAEITWRVNGAVVALWDFNIELD